MLHIKAKIIRLSLSACVMSALLMPAISVADTAMVLAEAETGSVAARQAADQKAALAKKAEERAAKKAQKAAEAEKAAAAKKPKPAETQVPVVEPIED
ncbi:hypothetical protein A1359_09610 [Methylomonas lenta]|uniref:Uncharacterized protein n=1 Tax=Methylomonas lenta TaxID=980561 RepID=A0A177NE32_9GAMM|nr:hypothetical protein [Methylomonas lenta]OAI15310.1 hypothetical protein A1359_09610 [Methylomonas lenta]